MTEAKRVKTTPQVQLVINDIQSGILVILQKPESKLQPHEHAFINALEHPKEALEKHPNLWEYMEKVGTFFINQSDYAPSVPEDLVDWFQGNKPWSRESWDVVYEYAGVEGAKTETVQETHVTKTAVFTMIGLN